MKRIVSLLLVMVLSFSFVSELKLEIVSAETVENESVELKLDIRKNVYTSKPQEKVNFSFVAPESRRYKISFLNSVVYCSYYDDITDTNIKEANITKTYVELEEGEKFDFTVSFIDETEVGRLTVIVTHEGVSVSDIKSTTIVSGVENKVDIINSKGMTCDFVPEESGWYKFYSSGNCDVKGTIVNSSFETIAESNNYDFDFLGIYHISGNFKLFQYFEAGETYYLHAYPTDKEGTYYLGVEKLSKANGVSILQQEEVDKGIGFKEKLKLNYSPQDCIPEKETWTSDNPDIIFIDEEGVCHFKKYGTATVTVTTESGLSDSITVHVTSSSQIMLNEEKTGYAGHYQEAEYIFIPEVSGKYAFHVTSDSGMMQQASIRTYIYDKDYNLVASDNKWSADSTLYYDMKKGECYCLKWDSYGGDVYGFVTATVKLTDNPDYETEIDSTDELQQVGEEITVEDIKEIRLDEEKQIDISYFDASSIHKFIPAEDGEYKFTVRGNDWVLVDVSDTDCDMMSGPFTVKLVGGNEYIIKSRISRKAYSGLGKYSIEINKLPEAEAISIINGDKIVEHIGYSEVLNVGYTPEECATEEFEWTSSDDSVVEVKKGIIYLKDTGTATITVKSENGLEDTIEVECIHYPEIECANNQSLTTTEKSVTFTFMPEVSGVYNFSMNPFFEDMEYSVTVTKVPQEKELSFLTKEFIDFDYRFMEGEIYYISVASLSENVVGVVKYSLELQSTLNPKGDVNEDGRVSAEDALLVLKVSAKLNKLRSDNNVAADYNTDGVVNADDALQILKVAAKIK